LRAFSVYHAALCEGLPDTSAECLSVSSKTETSVRHAVLVLNPAAGRGRATRAANQVEQAVRAALEHRWPGCRLRLVETSLDRGAEVLARLAIEGGADLLIAAGGDGTLHGVVNAAAGTSAIAAHIPLGTGNDFARAIGIPSDIAGAVRVLMQGRVAPMDLGCHDGRYFINVAGCGLDAVVAQRVNSRYRAARGRLAYLVAVLASLMSYRAVPMTVRAGGMVIQDRMMLCAVANGISYGGGMRIAPQARWDDGLLDVCIVRECGALEFLRAFPLVFSGKHLNHPKVQYLRAKAVHVASDPPVPVLMDGEVTGFTPARFGIAPGVLLFLAP